MHDHRKDHSARERVDEFVRELERLRPRIIAYCRHLLWDSAELDDVLQTAIVTAFESFSRFEAGTNFPAWFFRICTHVVYNANRRYQRDAARFVSTSPEELDIAVELEREYAYEELLSQPERVLSHVGDEMHRALMALTAPERSVFLLKTIAELSCREIAATLGIPMGSVMGYLTRARGKLRCALAEYARQEGIVRLHVSEAAEDELPQG